MWNIVLALFSNISQGILVNFVTIVPLFAKKTMAAQSHALTARGWELIWALNVRCDMCYVFLLSVNPSIVERRWAL